MQAHARRARTIVATSSPVDIGVLGDRRPVGKHLVDTDGTVMCRPDVMAGDCVQRLEAGAPSPVLDLVAVDVCSVPQPDRQRGSVHLRGRVTVDAVGLAEPWSSLLGMPPGRPAARFVAESVTLRVYAPPGSHSEAVVEVADYQAAWPDALAGWESDWIQHLDARHQDVLHQVVAARYQLGAHARVRALRADERGLDVRVYDDGCVADLRVPFPARVRCGCHAVEAFNAVLAASGSGPGG